jgi:hypothetical protein
LYHNRVLSDPAMQTVVGGATPIVESGRGEGISTAAFDIRKENEITFGQHGNVLSAAILLGRANKFILSSAALL